MSDEDFGRAMAGDAILGATDALLDEIVDFFPNPKRAILRGKQLEILRDVFVKNAPKPAGKGGR